MRVREQRLLTGDIRHRLANGLRAAPVRKRVIERVISLKKPSAASERPLPYGRGSVRTYVVAFVLMASLATADDEWTSFRNGPRQLGIAATALPDDLKLLWEYPAADGVTGTAAIAGGRVYVGTIGGKLLCLELRTGKRIWEYRSLTTDDPKAFLPGFQTPVTLSAELVIAGDEDGTLHAVDRQTGKARWTFPTDGEVVGGAAIVGDAHDRVIFGSHALRLFCLTLADGKQVWEFDTQGPVNGSQAIGDGHTFVTGCDQPVLRVVNIDSGTEETTIGLEGLLIATPALKGDVLYFGTSEGIVFAIDWKQQTVLWKYADEKRPFEIHSSPAVTDELVIIGSRDKRLHAINRQTGQVEWTFTTRGGVDSSPVVAGGRVYVGSRDKQVYGVNLSDGTEAWSFNAAQPIAASPAIAEGCLVIGTDAADGRILCFGSK